jgi:hypothetical protein
MGALSVILFFEVENKHHYFLFGSGSNLKTV